MEYHGFITRFSFLGNVLVIEGWANHLALELTYQGRLVALSIARTMRPELADFAPGAENWGFAACCALPTDQLARSDFRLKMNEGIPDAEFAAYFNNFDLPFLNMSNYFLEKVKAATNASMLEIGSRARSGNSYRHLFPTIGDYVGIDITDGPNVDVVGDAHHLTRYFDRKFDFIFSIAVFEHILMPWKVAIEMNRVLRDGGLAWIISHAAYPLHEEPWDFFRFSKDSWKGLFNTHTGFEVIDTGYQYETAIVPQYMTDQNSEQMSRGKNYLLSGCIVRKIGAPTVWWDAEVSQVYDLNYVHA